MITKIQALRVALNQQFLERSTLIDGMLTALVSSDPLLMIGPPGTAKSAICRAICQSVQGNYFSWCMSKLTTPEELFGPISLKALEQDRYSRQTTGKLPSADVAFLDEIFKASSATNNTLLTITNEKEFFNDGKPNPVPLRVLYAASNEVPQGEELAAMYDRFVLKYYVDAVKEDSSVDKLFLGLGKVTMPNISLKEIDALQAVAQNPTMDDVKPVLEPLKIIRRAIENEGILVSDRKWVQSVRILKAYSMLQGHDHIELDDLEILEHVLWSSIEQASKVRKIVSKVSNPLGEKILTVMDGVKEISECVNKGTIDPVEGFKKVKHAAAELKKLLGDGTNSKLKEAHETVKKIQQHIATTHLGLSD